MERPLVAVGAVIMDNNSVLLVRRKNPPGEQTWAIPGGKVEYGETLEMAIKREIKEETGLEIKVEEPLAIVEIISEGFHYVIIDFKAKIERGKVSPSSDALDARFFNVDEAIKMKDVNVTTRELLNRLKNSQNNRILHIIQISK